MVAWKSLFATVVGLSATLCLAEEAKPEAVITLTGSTFEAHIEEHPLTLVEFYAPWCGHCKKLAPEFEAAAQALKESGGIPLAKVDATEEKELAQKYEVQGFPTLFLFRKGKHEPYKGGRTKDAIIDWIEMISGPAVIEMPDLSTIEKETSGKYAVAFAGCFASKDSNQYKMYTEIADTHRDLGKFYAYISQDSKHLNQISAMRKDETTPMTTTVGDKETLSKWLTRESFPLFGPINGEVYSRYAKRSDSWVWVAGPEDAVKKISDAVRKVSKTYREDYNFVWVDVKQFENHAKSLGLEHYPGVAVQTPEGKYLFQQDITEKGLTKFIEAVRAGKIAKSYKSEDIPEKNDEPVKIIVGKAFEDMVLKSNKDVLLEIYAPWCGHCKQLQPIYDEFATNMKGVSTLMIAKMDGTANEIPFKGFEVQGFPTIYFIRAGDTEPIPFKGDRTVEGMTKFVKEKAKHPIDIASKDEL